MSLESGGKMFCSKCGTKNDSGAFCVSCGASLVQTSTPPANPQPTYVQQPPMTPPAYQPQQPGYQLPPQQPMGQAPYYPAPQANVSNTMSTLAIIFGAIGLLFVPLLFGTAGLVFGIIAKSKNEPRANVGLTISIIGLVGGVIFGAIVGASFGI